MQITVRQLLREGIPVPISLLMRIEAYCSRSSLVGGMDIIRFMSEVPDGTIDGLPPFIDKTLFDYCLLKLEGSLKTLSNWEERVNSFSPR